MPRVSDAGGTKTLSSPLRARVWYPPQFAWPMPGAPLGIAPGGRRENGTAPWIRQFLDSGFSTLDSQLPQGENGTAPWIRQGNNFAACLSSHAPYISAGFVVQSRQTPADPAPPTAPRGPQHGTCGLGRHRGSVRPNRAGLRVTPKRRAFRGFERSFGDSNGVSGIRTEHAGWRPLGRASPGAPHARADSGAAAAERHRRRVPLVSVALAPQRE